MRRLSILALMLVGLLLATSPASACQCIEKSATTFRVEHSDVVFLNVEVVETTETADGPMMEAVVRDSCGGQILVGETIQATVGRDSCASQIPTGEQGWLALTMDHGSENPGYAVYPCQPFDQSIISYCATRRTTPSSAGCGACNLSHVPENSCPAMPILFLFAYLSIRGATKRPRPDK